MLNGKYIIVSFQEVTQFSAGDVFLAIVAPGFKVLCPCQENSTMDLGFVKHFLNIMLIYLF